jgi:hypothetical protein
MSSIVGSRAIAADSTPRTPVLVFHTHKPPALSIAAKSGRLNPLWSTNDELVMVEHKQG